MRVPRPKAEPHRANEYRFRHSSGRRLHGAEENTEARRFCATMRSSDSWGKALNLAVSSQQSFTGARALVVEDEEHLATGLRRLLGRAGVHVTVVRSVEAARAILETETRWDLVLLDQKLPDGDGLQVLDRLEQLGHRPALVAVSAHLQESKRSLRLQAYPGVLLPKPFDRDDLLEAVADALLLAERDRKDSEREEPLEGSSGEHLAVLSFGPISVDLVFQTVTVEGESVDLQPVQFRILAQMLSTPGRALSVAELVETALRGTHGDGGANIRFQIHSLRRRLGSCGKLIERAEGGYGVGLSNRNDKRSLPT